MTIENKIVKKNRKERWRKMMLRVERRLYNSSSVDYLTRPTCTLNSFSFSSTWEARGRRSTKASRKSIILLFFLSKYHVHPFRSIILSLFLYQNKQTGRLCRSYQIRMGPGIEWHSSKTSYTPPPWSLHHSKRLDIFSNFFVWRVWENTSQYVERERVDT